MEELIVAVNPTVVNLKTNSEFDKLRKEYNKELEELRKKYQAKFLNILAVPIDF